MKKLILFLLICSCYIQARAQNDKQEHVFTKVEINGGYPGGEQAWAKYLKTHLVYPAQTDSVIHVEVRFVIDKMGYTSDFKSSGGTIELRKEAERVVKNSGNWNPASQCGRLVRAYKTLVISFPPM